MTQSKTQTVLRKDTLKNIKDIIKSYGMPAILFQVFECRIYAYPDSLEETDMDLIFREKGLTVAAIEKPSVVLRECHRPDNLIIECKKCYRICDEKGKGLNTYIYW